MNVRLSLPKRWLDLKDGQLEQISTLFLKYQDKHEFLTQCFLRLSGWRIVRWMMWFSENENHFFFKVKGHKLFCIPAEIFMQLVQSLQWLLDGYNVPSYVPPIKGFQSPSLLLFEISIEQFLTTENYYNAFVETANFKQLDKMIACLYCKSFTNLNLEKQAKAIGQRRISSRYASFLWYSGIKTWLRNKYPHVFSGSSTDDDVPPDAVVLNLLSSLNEGDITRNDKILKTRMHEALYELNNKIEYSNSQKHV